MKIVIHGTKGGYQTFYPNYEFRDYVSDPCNDSPQVGSLGSEAYSLEIGSNFKIFTKTKIIRDVQGDKRIGSINYSLIFEGHEIHDGKTIVESLDEISTEYESNYLVDGINLVGIQEDWSFVLPISEKIKNNVKTPPMAVSSKDKGACSIEFKDKLELETYFNLWFKVEFVTSERIFFVSAQYTEINTPLNALKDSLNISGSIMPVDTRLQFVKINLPQNFEILFYANGKKLDSGDYFEENSNLKLEVTRSDYYKSKFFEFSLNNIDSKRYLKMLENKRIEIDYNSFEGLIWEQKECQIVFEIFSASARIDSEDCEILVRCGNQERRVRNQIILQGKELAYNYTFKAIRGSDRGLPEEWTFNGEVKVVIQLQIHKLKAEYAVNPGNHGTFKKRKEYFSVYSDGRDMIEKIEPEKGYELIGFELSDNDILVAKYRKKRNIGLVLTVIMPIVVVAVLCWKLYPNMADGGGTNASGGNGGGGGNAGVVGNAGGVENGGGGGNAEVVGNAVGGGDVVSGGNGGGGGNAGVVGNAVGGENSGSGGNGGSGGNAGVVGNTGGVENSSSGGDSTSKTAVADAAAVKALVTKLSENPKKVTKEYLETLAGKEDISVELKTYFKSLIGQNLNQPKNRLKNVDTLKKLKECLGIN